MKSSALAAASFVVLAGLAVAVPASAKEGPELRLRDTVARVVVIVEDRADVAVEVQQGSAGLPPVRVSRAGDELRIDGGLGRNAIRNCSGGAPMPRQPGDGASVEVRGKGRVPMSAAPLIVVRSPRHVEVNIERGAVFGAIGRGASAISLGNAGCGDWTLANTSGDLELSLAGSGNIWAGESANLEVSLAGSGDITAGATRSLEANLAGSGNITAARVTGPVEASIAGSGNVIVRSDAGPVSASIAGSGDVSVRGRASSVEASIMGSGNVNVGSVAGSVSRSVMGSGTVNVGR